MYLPFCRRLLSLPIISSSLSSPLSLSGLRCRCGYVDGTGPESCLVGAEELVPIGESAASGNCGREREETRREEGGTDTRREGRAKIHAIQSATGPAISEKYPIWPNSGRDADGACCGSESCRYRGRDRQRKESNTPALLWYHQFIQQ